MCLQVGETVRDHVVSNATLEFNDETVVTEASLEYVKKVLTRWVRFVYRGTRRTATQSGECPSPSTTRSAMRFAHRPIR